MKIKTWRSDCQYRKEGTEGQIIGRKSNHQAGHSVLGLSQFEILPRGTVHLVLATSLWHRFPHPFLRQRSQGSHPDSEFKALPLAAFPEVSLPAQLKVKTWFTGVRLL